MGKFILIGMSGSGKTSIGKMVSETTGLKFIDLDEEIEKKYGNISEIFDKYGEDVFREYENHELKTAVESEDTVISTGGGILTNPDNVEHMKNGIVIFIDRALENILLTMDETNRPMVRDKPGMIERLFNERYETYEDLMDYRISNDGSLEKAVHDFIEILNNCGGVK